MKEDWDTCIGRSIGEKNGHPDLDFGEGLVCIDGDGASSWIDWGLNDYTRCRDDKLRMNFFACSSSLSQIVSHPSSRELILYTL